MSDYPLYRVKSPDHKGRSYVRLASTVGELPTPTMRRQALEAIQRVTGIAKIQYSVPVYQTLGLRLSQAQLNSKRDWLLLKGKDLPLSLLEGYYND